MMAMDFSLKWILVTEKYLTKLIVIRGCIFADSIEIDASESVVIYKSVPNSESTLAFTQGIFSADQLANFPRGFLSASSTTIKAVKGYVSLGGCVTGGLSISAKG